MSLSQSIKLNEHQWDHTGDKQCVCNMCPKSFSNNYKLSIHTNFHTGDKPYSCFSCEKSFPDPSGLSQHNKTIGHIIRITMPSNYEL